MEPQDPATGDNATASNWYRFGVVVGICNLAFIAILVVLLQYDLLVGVIFAVVVSVLSGLAITVYALGQR